MERYGVTRAPESVKVVDPPTWGEYISNLTSDWSTTSAVIVIAIPWTLLLLYVVHYWLFKRPTKLRRTALGPFLSFYTLLTDGATPGFDKKFMSIFAPALLESGQVEKGVLRAMARCVTDTFGAVQTISRDAVVRKSDASQVNCVALVDFARKKEVTCQLSWVRRPMSDKERALMEQGKKKGTSPANGHVYTPDEVVDDIGMAPLNSFRVTGFRIEQRRIDGRPQPLDVLTYLRVEEFEPFAEEFVEQLFEKPPVRAVDKMLPALQEKYRADKAASLEDSIQKVVRAAGGLGSRGQRTNEVDVILTEEKILKSTKPRDAGEGGETSARTEETTVEGFQMVFHIGGVSRNIEVELRFTIVGMRCYVTRYEVRLLPDHHTQVVVDRDTGDMTLVG